MPKKMTTVFFCNECGYESAKWMGQCPACKSWNTFTEENISKQTAKSSPTRKSALSSEVVKLSEVSVKEDDRLETGIEELDRVLGGGIVPGSLTLVGGDPGIGKSTLLLQVCHKLSSKGVSVLYVSGEESKIQIKLRADRIGAFGDDMSLLCETDLDLISDTISKNKPSVVVIDSIQTMYSENVSSAPGSVSQVRETTAVLLQLA
ncbi:MAG: AAA family ATPase, partial [Lachnospiraceae bacterium]|nr:AAA family ATPase [Lachnospiraceae bacterium]